MVESVRESNHVMEVKRETQQERAEKFWQQTMTAGSNRAAGVTTSAARGEEANPQSAAKALERSDVSLSGKDQEPLFGRRPNPNSNLAYRLSDLPRPTV